MSESEKVIVGANDPTLVDEHNEAADVTEDETVSPSTQAEAFGRDDSHVEGSIIGGAPPSSSAAADERVGNEAGEGSGDQPAPIALETGNSKPETVVGLCHHVMETGYYCQSPALRDRDFCYGHLRLLGRRARMARAVAQRQPWTLVLPPLDDMHSVLAGLSQVADGVAAGLLPPRQADQLLYTLRQAGVALRWMERSRVTSARSLTAGAPPYWGPQMVASSPPDRGPHGVPGLHSLGSSSPDSGERVGNEQKRLVEEYPDFEAEFGQSAGLDLSKPLHELFPPDEQVWPAATSAAATAQAAIYSDPPPPRPLWTKESVELEELEKRQEYMTEKSFNEQSCKIRARIHKQVETEMRKEREAEWQAEADRRNAVEGEKDRIYRAMNDGERRAYQLGIMEGVESARREAEEEARNRKPPQAAVGR